MVDERSVSAVFRHAGDVTDSEDEREQEKFVNKHRKGLISSALVLTWFLAGIGVCMKLGDFTFITATYLITQIVTTIGYGDLSIDKSLHWFFTFYVLVGLAIVAAIVNEYSQQVLAWESRALKRKLRDFERDTFADKIIDEDSDIDHIDDIKDETLKEKFGARNTFIASTMAFLFFWAFGTIFYSWYESCSCSYGASRVEECSEKTWEECAASGAQTKTWGECVYMSLITITTVGFGDFSPQTRLGRSIGVVWMIFGVLATGNFISAIGDVIDHWMPKKKENNCPVFCRQLFNDIDTNRNGVISHGEFFAWMLVKDGIVEKEVMDRYRRIFNNLDANGTGKLEYAVLEKTFM